MAMFNLRHVVAMGQTVAELWRFINFFQYGGRQPFWICCARVSTTHEEHLRSLLLCKIWLESKQQFR